MNINFRDKKQEKCFIEAISFFGSKKIPYYAGGSRYFGYNNEKSDLDLFFSVSLSNQYLVTKELLKLGFVSTSSSYYESDIFDDLQFRHKQNNIQIISIKNDVFDEFEIAHKTIKTEIILNPSIIPILKKLKVFGLKGAEIYRLLKLIFRL